MTQYHPRALADKLAGLLPELQRWSHRASMALDNAQIQQKRIEDKHLQTDHSAQMHENQLVVDQENVQQDDEQLQVCATNCHEALAKAQQTASTAQSILHKTQATHNRMQQTLQSAQEALQQAEQALDRATANLESQMAELAQDNTHLASLTLLAAKKAQSQARSAVRAASTHVANCTKAVTLVSQALQLATVAHQHAQAGLKASEDSIGFVRAASKASDLGKRELGQEDTVVKATLEVLQQTALITQESSTQLVVARSHEQPAQQHTAETLRVLQLKIDLLIFMNRPELNGVSGALAASLQLATATPRGDQSETLSSRLERLQTELAGIYGLKRDEWRNLDREQRAWVLQTAHDAVAAAYRFNACSVEVTPLSPRLNGAFYHKTEHIEINAKLVTGNDNVQPLRTLFHESRHAYQWHFSQPVRRGFGWYSEAEWTLAKEWNDNFGDYKSAEKDSFQDYYNQPIEVDARSFADTVIKLLFGV